MSGNCELGRGLRTREYNATDAGAGRCEKPAPDARAAPPEAHESPISRKTVEEVPLTGLSFGVALDDGLPGIHETGSVRLSIGTAQGDVYPSASLTAGKRTVS